jgi:coatomer subunit beta'
VLFCFIQLFLCLFLAAKTALRIWHSTTYRLANTLIYGMNRVWALASNPRENLIGVGCDGGSLCLKMGQELPVVSMDAKSGRVIWCKNNNEVLGANVRTASKDSDLVDGEPLSLQIKELGTAELLLGTTNRSCIRPTAV